ncbi:uncharacterized protein LOC144862931 isoform X2 [Branchiostoma floridae x Branchiostoma japonicum]
MARLIHYDDQPIKVLQYLDHQRRADIPPCDTKVKIEGRHFPAHKIVLRASSGYFDTLFKAQTGETREVDLSGLTTQGFSAMLDMMYTSQLQISTGNVMEVQVAASYLHVMDVVADCTRFLTTSLASGHMMTDSTTVQVLHYPSHPAKLLQHFDSQRRQHQSSCDITIKVKDESFPAHKAILMASSGYLRTVLSGKQNMNEVELHGLTKEGISATLDMMYTSQLQLSAQNVIDVQIAASYLHMMDIVADCTQFLHECIRSGCMANDRLVDRSGDYEHDLGKPETTFAARSFPSTTAEISRYQNETVSKSSPIGSTGATNEHFQAPSPVQGHANWAIVSSSSTPSHSNADCEVIVKRESEDWEDVMTMSPEGAEQHQTNAAYFEDCMDGTGVNHGTRERSQASPMSNLYGNNFHQQGQGIQELQTNMACTGRQRTSGAPLHRASHHHDQSDVMHYSREQMLAKNETNNAARNWFRRVVRETVNRYEMTGLRSVHIDDAMAEVFRRCPSLKPDDIWDIRRQFRNFLSNKSGHQSRKERGYLVPSKRMLAQRRSQEGADTPLSPASSVSSANIHSGGEESIESQEQGVGESTEC